MTKALLLILSCLLISNIVFGVEIKRNTKDLIFQKPKLIAQVPNGQKLLIGDLNDPEKNILYLANLKGTPFQMGEAYGKLFKDQLKQQINTFYKYYMDSLEDIIDKKLPKFLGHQLRVGVDKLLHKVLDLNVMITKRYTNPRYYEEIKGIAKGSGMDPKQISRLNIFPELIKAACTVAGVWGKASLNQKTLHMRALDWDSKNPISKFPVVAIYHPSDKKLQAHANFAWVGFVGSLTGMSQKLSIGQKVWLPPKGSVQMTRYGNPWTYMFRDILYDAKNLQQAIKILQTTHRTCAIHIGIASADDHSFRMFEYAEKVVNIYDDKNYTYYNNNHLKKDGIAFFDKHVQPSNDGTVSQVLNSNLYGHWQAESFWRTLGFTHQTGDTQLVVFNLQDQEVFISYSQYNGTQKAFERRPILLNMAELFADF